MVTEHATVIDAPAMTVYGLVTDPLRMPRIEAHGVDGEAIIRTKVLGTLAPYRLTDSLRQAQRSA